MRFFTAILLSAAAVTSSSIQAQDVAAADTFEREVAKLLKASHANKRGVVVHVGGESIAGVVKAIGPDAIVMANQQYNSIVVRREKIDAVEAN